MPVAGYIVSTTRSGCEYIGHSDCCTLAQHELERLVRRAVEIETLAYDKPAVLSDGPQCKKRVASPTPLDVSPHAYDEHLGSHFDTDSTAAGIKSLGVPLEDILTLKPPRKNGSHLRRKKKKQSEMNGNRRDTVTCSETPVDSILVYDSESIQAQTTGYNGLTRQEIYPHLNLEGMRQAGYRTISWNGIEALPILDDNGTVYAVFAGRPRATDYVDCCRTLYLALDEVNTSIQFLPKQLNHRRGKYPTVDLGLTADQGQPEPKNINIPANVSEAAGVLSDSQEMQRVLNFCDSAYNTGASTVQVQVSHSHSPASFQKWAPKLHAYYRETMDKLQQHPKYESLKRPGKTSVFGSMSHNYGRSVITVPHRDYKNLAFGWCAIVALGDFDPTKGGHLVLHEPRLVVEFPPSSAALIPSAVLTHSNALLCPSDRRASVTFYSSGSLFRFVENDFQTLRSVKAKDEMEYHIRQATLKGVDVNGNCIAGEGRWAKGLALYSTLEQLSLDVFE